MNQRTFITGRRFIASSLFLLAALIVIYAGTFFYLKITYPTSYIFIKNNLSKPVITNVFKVEEAEKAGISETEIALHLTEYNKEKFHRYNTTVLEVELTFFVVWLLMGSGLIIMKRPNKL